MAVFLLLLPILCYLFETNWSMVSGTSIKKIILYRIGTQTHKDLLTQTHKAQQHAIYDINNDSDILPNYVFEFVPLESSGDDEKAMEHAITISKMFSECNANNDSIISPIILGCPWSSFSVLTARVFNIYHLLQISAAATSPILSGNRYTSFFRTIANDILQGKALIQLCKHYKWQRIGVIYMNDNYGENFNKVIQQQAESVANETIDVKSIAYIPDDIYSIEKAATFVAEHKLYITILIVQSADLPNMFLQFQTLNVSGYPYFYLGVDAWMSDDLVTHEELQKFVQGYIGTIPGLPSMLTPQQYNEFNIYQRNMTIHNITKQINERILQSLKKNTNQTINTFARYGHDSVYALAYALSVFSENHNNSLDIISTDCGSWLNDIQNELRNILFNMNEFIGASGIVKFDENGDRIGGFFVYGYIGSDNTLNYFGAMSDDNYFIHDNVSWPMPFRAKGHYPWSDVKIFEHKYGIDLICIIIISILHVISFIVALILCCLSSRKSFVLYMMTLGIFICIVDCVIYGMINYQQYLYKVDVDNHYNIYNIGCNFHLWLLCIVFSLSFLPLFSKEYTFKQIMNHKPKPQLDICKKICFAVCGDIIILLIFTIIEYLTLEYNNIHLFSYQFLAVDEYIDSDDELKLIKHEYPICSHHWLTNIFYCVIFFYKFIQIYIAIGNVFEYSGIKAISIIGLIASIWFLLNNILYFNLITKQQQFIILESLIMLINFIWTISQLIAYLKLKYLHNSAEEAENNNQSSTDHNRNESVHVETKLHQTNESETITAFNHSHKSSKYYEKKQDSGQINQIQAGIINGQTIELQ